MLQRVSFVAASALAAMAFTACGDDDDGGNPDARVFDAPITSQADARVFDAPPAATVDARPDAAVATHSATIALHDIKLFGTGTSAQNPLVKGGQKSISFSRLGVPVVAGASTSSFPPCGASVTDVTMASMNNPDLDEGTVTFTVTPSGGSARTLPACNFLGTSYRCVSAMGAAGMIATTANPAVGTFSNATTSFMATDVGNWLIVTSGAEAGRAWGIVGTSGMTAGLQASGTFPTAVANWIVDMGVGPIGLVANPDGSSPGPAPDFLANTDSVNVVYTAKTGAHFTNFAINNINVGDDFDVNATTQGLMTNGINVFADTPVALGCDSCGGATAAQGTIVNIETTDTAGGTATELLPPTKYRGNLTCSVLIDSTVTIPTSLLQVLRQGQPKKMRISVFRDNFGQASGQLNGVTAVVGHGVVAFPNVPQPQ